MSHTRCVSVHVLTLLASLWLMGCGGSSVVITPNFSHPDLRSANLKRDSVRIIHVTDSRPNPSSHVGTARVGMFNKPVPYILQGNLAAIVRTMLDTLITGRQDGDRFVPLSVSIDKFEVGEQMKLFSEEGYFACDLQFSFPVSADSQGQQVVSIRETDNSIVDVTDALEPLIYRGMVEGVRRFVEGTLDQSTSLMSISADSVDVIRTQDSVMVAARQEQRGQQSLQASPEQTDRIASEEMSFQYVQGDKIRTGIRLGYSMLSRGKESQIPFGFGIGLTYYDIINKKDLVAGTFVSFGGRLVSKYYFSSAPTTLYIGGNLGLAGGNEKIDYGVRTETTFFFGPTVEEVLGLSINRRVSFEFGSFQLAHFGSKILPSDIGFVAGLTIVL